MSIENRILSNIDYTIHNYSNYAISSEETRGIVDVPSFPAQNIVNTTGKISVYNPSETSTTRIFVPFIDENNNERLFAVLSFPDARLTFVEMADEARYFHYRFGGNSFPQGRSEKDGGESYTYNGTQLFVFGGYCNGRCTDDLWVYDINTNSWENLNFHTESIPVNEAPSKRRKASIVYFESSDAKQVWLFGGETDLLQIHSAESESFFVTLNDLWVFDLQSRMWANFDKNRILPHRPGHIVHIDMTKVRIYIDGGYNDIGVYEPPAIWTVDIATDTVTSTPYAGPFHPAHSNVCFTINGVIHILVGNRLYRWDENQQKIVLTKENIATINPKTKKYWTIEVVKKKYGQQSTMGEMRVSRARLYSWEGTQLSIKDINLPPRGSYIPRVNIDNQMIFWAGGLIDPAHFNESTYIMSSVTRQVYKYDFPEEQRPTERVYHSLAYDRYRGRVWLFGGFDGSKYYNDLWYFDLNEKKWYQEHGQLENTDDQNPDYPQPRQKAGMAVVLEGRFLYILGGYSDTHAFDDFWVYDIEKKEWTEVFLVENIPWGSVYYLFEWRDRLWLYNGQKLYRYFYGVKQFCEQPFLIPDSENDPIAELIRQRKYLETPVQCTVVNDRLFVRNSEYHFYVDMETRVVCNLRRVFDISEDVVWLDKHHGMALTQSGVVDLYINVSPLYPLTKNQLPHSMDSGSVYTPYRDIVVLRDYLTSEGKNKWKWIDKAGEYSISAHVEELDKTDLLLEQNVSIAGTHSDFPDVNFSSEEEVLQKTIETLAQPYVATYRPLFKYNLFLPVAYKYRGISKVYYNPRTKYVYLVYQTGHVVEYHTQDGTFFVYYTHLWEGSAIGYYEAGNKIYCFGGLTPGTGYPTYATYTQHGLECATHRLDYIMDPITGYADPKTHKKKRTGFETGPTYLQKSHCGLLEFDLNINRMNLGTLQNLFKEKRVRLIDYTLTRDYLYNIVKHYIEGYATNTIPETIEEVKHKVYTSLQPIVDDLSQFDIVREQGERPRNRAYMAHCQIGNKLYIFGGVECYNIIPPPNVPCDPVYTNPPYACVWVGVMENSFMSDLGQSEDNLIDPKEESKRCFVFDMSKKEWEEIAPLPEWRYMSSAIPSPDGSKIYLVGGFGDIFCKSPSRDIFVYDVKRNEWEKIQGIPSKFTPRAAPILFWLDEYHLVIAYGILATLVTSSEESCIYKTWIFTPVSDAWIYDTRHKIIYKAWEDVTVPGAMMIKDNFTEESENEAWIVPVTEIKTSVSEEDKSSMKILRADLTTGELEVHRVKLNAYMLSVWKTSAAVDEIAESIVKNKQTDLSVDTISNLVLDNSRIRFRYGWIERIGAENYKHLFLIADVIDADAARIDWIAELAQGNIPAKLVIMYANLEAVSPQFHTLECGYPLPTSPKVVAYDGSRYIYVIYNKYNIWRLDFRGFIEEPNRNHWHLLPPCINCNFLELERSEVSWTGYFTKPHYLTIVSNDGRVARMDTHTFVWFLDKSKPPTPPLESETLLVAGLDDSEIYMYSLGGVSGKVMNVYEKQWDNFYFDMQVVRDVVRKFPEIVAQGLWPTFVKRRRLYTMNHQGHILYAWLRIQGVYDVEFQLNNFYKVDEVRVYGDYTFLTQSVENTEVSVFHISRGWVEIDKAFFSVQMNETGWDWDAEFSNGYVRQIITPEGVPVYQYSKCPPNYLKVDIRQALGTDDAPLSKIRVKYQNTPQDYNYISRINKVEAITTQTELAAYDNPSATNPVKIIQIEPITIDDSFSKTFAVTVKNTGSDPVIDVVTYVYNNKWLQFSFTPDDEDSWTIRDQTYPFKLTDKLEPGSVVVFYIRAVNRDYRPHKADLVVKGVYRFRE